MPSRRTMITRDLKRNSRARKATHRSTQREALEKAANLKGIEERIRERLKAAA